MAKTRVAAYCRVSTDQDDQRNSLQNQKQFFAAYIAGKPDWDFVGIWADEGISGTSTRGRRQFCAMLAAAERGEIDLILTKEVSRFARNTVDTLACTRRLKEIGVGVCFLNDNIDTRAGDSEFRLTIMASVAQEESRKTSERVKWGQKRSMERGVVFGADTLYGYRLQSGVLTPVPAQAETVRLIYHKFLQEGKGTYVIARELSEAGVPAPRAVEKPWSSVMVLRILRNEKYCGDLLQKKTCTPDFLTHKKVKNDGLEEQVYLRSHHEAIINRELFEAVQQELDRRAPSGTRHSVQYWCSGRLVCGLCGQTLTPRRTVRADGGLTVRWVCRTPGCAQRPVDDRTVHVCVGAALAKAGVDTESVVSGLLARWQMLWEQHGGEGGLPVERRRATLLRRRKRLLDAYCAGALDETEWRRRDRCCASDLETILEPAKSTNAQRPESWRDWLSERIYAAAAVHAETLERAAIWPYRVQIRLCGTAVDCTVGYRVEGRGAGLRTIVTACESCQIYQEIVDDCR